MYHHHQKGTTSSGGNNGHFENWGDSAMAEHSQQTDTSTDIETDDKNHVPLSLSLCVCVSWTYAVSFTVGIYRLRLHNGGSSWNLDFFFLFQIGMIFFLGNKLEWLDMPCPARFELPEGYNGVLVRDCLLDYITVNFSNLANGPLIMQLNILICSFLNYFEASRSSAWSTSSSGFQFHRTGQGKNRWPKGSNLTSTCRDVYMYIYFFLSNYLFRMLM